MKQEMFRHIEIENVNAKKNMTFLKNSAKCFEKLKVLT